MERHLQVTGCKQMKTGLFENSMTLLNGPKKEKIYTQLKIYLTFYETL